MSKRNEPPPSTPTSQTPAGRRARVSGAIPMQPLGPVTPAPAPPPPVDVAMMPAPLTPLRTRSQRREPQEELFSPYSTVGTLKWLQKRAIITSGYGIVPPQKSTEYQKREAALFGQILVKWGVDNINLHPLYKKYGVQIGRDELPGIYIICACVENGPLNHTPCQNCTMVNAYGDAKPRLFKVGLARDLATRFNQYHTDYPYGFTVLAVYVMTDETGALLDSTHPGYGRLLETMERAFLLAFLDVSELNVTTRPGTAEFFLMSPKYVQKGLFDNTLTRLTQWSDEFAEKWRKRNSGLTPPINSAKYVVYSERITGLTGILVPYEKRNFDSLTSESTGRSGEVATMTVLEAQEGRREESYRQTAATRTKAARKKRQAQPPGGASNVFVVDSEEEDSEDSDYSPE